MFDPFLFGGWLRRSMLRCLVDGVNTQPLSGVVSATPGRVHRRCDRTVSRPGDSYMGLLFDISPI